MAVRGGPLERLKKSHSVKLPVLFNGSSPYRRVRENGCLELSFEGNQSYPKATQKKQQQRSAPMKMEWVKGDSSSFISFSSGSKRGSNQSPIHASTSRDDAWLLVDNSLTSGLHTSNSVLLFDASLPFVSANKAVFTILIPSSQILVVNSVACKLLDYSSEELCSLKLESLVHDHHKSRFKSVLESSSKDVIFNNGKVIELVHKEGISVPVSLFIKKIDTPQRCLAVAEPVDRRVASLTVDSTGKILSCDDEVAAIFQYDTTELLGLDVRSLIPAVVLRDTGPFPKEGYKQKVTGRTREGACFPLCLVVSRSCASLESWQVILWVYANLSGLIVLDKDLAITNCNHHFTKLLFGVPKNQVLGQNVTKLIPNFCQDLEYGRDRCATLYQSENSDSDNSVGKEDGVTWGRSFDVLREAPPREDTCSFTPWTGPTLPNINEVGIRNSKSDELFTKSDNESAVRSVVRLHTTVSNKELQRAVLQDPPLPLIKNRQYRDSMTIGMEEVCEGLRAASRGGSRDGVRARDGHYAGYGRHHDGTCIDVIYRVKTVAVEGKTAHCVWVTRDPWEAAEGGRTGPANMTLTSSFNSTSLEGSMTRDSLHSEQRQSSASVISQCDEILTAGDYSEHYTNLQQIGKGAFGYVKMAYRSNDGFLVITKFIKKQKINVRSWVQDPHLNMKVPLEISLLTTLEHPNIVKVLDVFHNDSFFQLVMEKHGAGLDLFEFIDRRPKMDERLDSYIFRQMVSAVHYLDSLGILHRDIKDENVIINETFQVKLIDFGSATFMSPDRLFSTFYGTVEYCSPEVLQGNKYRGPELEIWALGVTLYVLTFGENPFYDVEETIKGKFSMPLPISAQLHELLHAMLEKRVELRASIERVMRDPWVNQPVDIDKYQFENVVRCYKDEAYPVRYMSEYCLALDGEREEDGVDGPDGDDDRTVASSNSFCSLHTIENMDCLDRYEECFQEPVLRKKDPVVRCSVPSYILASTPKRDRERITKSVSSLHGPAGGKPPGQARTHTATEEQSNNNPVQKRFSLDLNMLKRLNNSPCCRRGGLLKEVDDADGDTAGELEREIMAELEKLRLAENNNDRPAPGDGEVDPDCYWDAVDEKYDCDDSY